LDLLLNIRRISSVFNDTILDLLMLHEQFAQLSASISHDIEQIFCDHTLVANSSVPNNTSDSFRDALGPQLPHPGRRLEIVPVVQDLFLPNLGQLLFLLELLLEFSLESLLLLLQALHVLLSVFLYELIHPHHFGL